MYTFFHEILDYCNLNTEQLWSLAFHLDKATKYRENSKNLNFLLLSKCVSSAYVLTTTVLKLSKPLDISKNITRHGCYKSRQNGKSMGVNKMVLTLQILHKAIISSNLPTKKKESIKSSEDHLYFSKFEPGGQWMNIYPFLHCITQIWILTLSSLWRDCEMTPSFFLLPIRPNTSIYPLSCSLVLNGQISSSPLPDLSNFLAKSNQIPFPPSLVLRYHVQLFCGGWVHGVEELVLLKTTGLLTLHEWMSVSSKNRWCGLWKMHHTCVWQVF